MRRGDLILDIIGVAIALFGFLAAWRELDKYRVHRVTYKLAKDKVMLWLIILLCAMNFIRGDLWR